MSGQLQGFRLSPQQRHVWRLQADSRAYRSQCAVRLQGALEPERLREALGRVVARHEILRTVFRRSPGVRFPIQVVMEGLAPQWQTADLTAEPEEAQRARLDELFRQAARRPFDLERGPAVHATLVTCAPERHVLLLGLPALCGDGRTLELLVRELAGAFAEEPAGDGDRLQYVQFGEWQNELLESEEGRDGREHWSRQDLSPVFDLRLPLEADGKGGGFAPESLAVDLGDAAVRLDGVAASLGAPAAAVLLAAWQVLLWRLSGGAGAGVGVLADGRPHEELAAAPGLFARYLPVPADLAGRLPFREAVARAAAALAEALDYQSFYAPEGRGEAGFPAGFAYTEAAGPCRAGGVAFTVVRQASWIDRYQVCLEVRRSPHGLAAELRYDTRTVSQAFAADLAERLHRLLAALLADPGVAVGEVGILTDAERLRLLAELNRTAVEVPAECVHRLFERQADRTPELVAVRLGDSRLTYAELAGRAGRLARHLAGLGVGPDVTVGVFAERSPEMVTGLLATLMAGGAYLPLDTAYPGERLAFLVEDARPRVILTQASLAERLPAGGARTVLLDDPAGWSDVGGTGGMVGTGDPADPADPDGGVTPDHLAYVLYTSGSTGRPKGVMVPHRGLVNYLSWAVREYRLEEGREVPVHSPIGFDLTVTSLLAPLLAGGTVLLLPEDRGVEALGQALREGGPYSLLKVTPAHLAFLGALLGQGLEDVEMDGRIGVLVVGGEALLGEYLAQWRQRAPSTRVVNEYGPTETVVGCTAFELPAGTAVPGPVPIGRPIANTRVYLLDAALQPVPFGVAGELYVGGAGVTRGYLARPGLTAERFVPDPFGGVPGARLYRTGDQARYRTGEGGGDLEFLGRDDHQVKIRGYRLELGEIEAALATHPGVREAVVMAREDVPGDRRLVGYVAATGETAPTVDDLRRHLAARLPDYMVPGVFIAVHAMPLTANGKVDRTLLPPPGTARPELEKEYVAPRTPVEETLAAVWAEVLGLDRVGVLDNFFALGGDSIRSVRVVALLKERGIDTSVEDLFRHQTIDALVPHLAGEGAATGDIGAAGEATEDEELARLVAELEGLSDEEAQERLREHIGAERS